MDVRDAMSEYRVREDQAVDRYSKVSRRIDQVEAVHRKKGKGCAREPDEETEDRVEGLGAFPSLRGGKEAEKFEVTEEDEEKVKDDGRHVGRVRIKIMQVVDESRLVVRQLCAEYQGSEEESLQKREGEDLAATEPAEDDGEVVEGRTDKESTHVGDVPGHEGLGFVPGHTHQEEAEAPDADGEIEGQERPVKLRLSKEQKNGDQESAGYSDGQP